MKSQWRAKKDLINSLTLHPEFPRKIWVVVEQPQNESCRLSYFPESGVFSKTAYKSLLRSRGFKGVSGWIGGSGIPSEFHHDVLLLTEQNPIPGEIIEGQVSGVFFQRDKDHKFVAMDEEFSQKVGKADIKELDSIAYEKLQRLYPEIGENEGWDGAEADRNYLANNQPVHD